MSLHTDLLRNKTPSIIKIQCPKTLPWLRNNGFPCRIISKDRQQLQFKGQMTILECSSVTVSLYLYFKWPPDSYGSEMSWSRGRGSVEGVTWWCVILNLSQNTNPLVTLVLGTDIAELREWPKGIRPTSADSGLAISDYAVHSSHFAEGYPMHYNRGFCFWDGHIRRITINTPTVNYSRHVACHVTKYM
jgi:hypothetical protein